MSVREYIGARYIPLFADPIQWDINTVYEPLTVVTNRGNSYVSRQAVPAGISLDNTDYWILWADYNAQLQAYIQEVQAYNGRISTLENDLPTSDFSSSNTVKDTIDNLAALLPGTDFDSDNTVKDTIDNLAALLPGTDFDSDNTVKDAIDTVNSTIVDLAALLPGTDFDSDNTVKDAIDNLGALLPTEEFNIEHTVKDAIVEANENNAKIAVYRAYAANTTDSDLIIAGSNDGLNWSHIKTLTFSGFDASNISWCESIQRYIVTLSGHIYALDTDFNITNDFGSVQYPSTYPQWWGANVQEIDGNTYLLVAAGNNTPTNNFVGQSQYGGFKLFMSEVQLDILQNTATFGTYTPIILSGYTTDNHIDPHVIKVNNTYILACKDETESNIELYTASVLSGPYSRVWVNPYLHGTEAPKVDYDEIKNCLYVYFSGYYATVTDQRADTTISDSSSNNYKVVNTLNIESSESRSIFSGRYTVDATTFANKGFMQLCNFELGIPRHFGMCTGKNTPKHFNSNCRREFYKSNIATCYEETTFVYNVVVNGSLLANNSNNYAICVPVLGNRTQIVLGGSLPNTFTGRLLICCVPINCETTNIPIDYHIGYADSRTNKLVYIGGYETPEKVSLVVPAGASIKEWLDRYTYTDLACVGNYGFSWYSSWRA